MQEDSIFSTPSPAIFVCRFFDADHSERCEVMPHCSFDLHFPNYEMLSIEIYTLPYVKFGNLLFDTWWSVTTWRGGMEWETGGKFKREGTYTCPLRVSAFPVGDCG